MRMKYRRLIHYFIIGGITLVLLSGCGSGGGKSSGNQDSGSSDEPALSFQPDSTVILSQKDLLSLSLNLSESGNDLVVLDINGKVLDTAVASGISADLKFDTAQMDFTGFESDISGIGTGMAAIMETEKDIVIIGLHTLKRSSGRLGKIKFRMKPGVSSGAISFTPALRYISTSSDLISTPSLTARGGTIILHD